MNQSYLNRFIMTIKERYPVFSPAIDRTISNNNDLFRELGGLSTQWAVKAFGVQVLESMVEGYAYFVTDVNREQFSYSKRGSYKNKSFKEVFDSVYNNDEYMKYYHWGVFATFFLWQHHLELYSFFCDRFLDKHLMETGNVIELGSGSGIWSILTATKKTSITVTGLDISKSSLDISTKLAKSAAVDDRANFCIADALTLETKEKYDAGMSAFLMEHLEDPAALVASLYRNLKPGAPLFLTAAVTAAEIDHIYEFRTEGQVVDILEKEGFRVKEMFSATPKTDPRLFFLPRSVAFIAYKKVTENW